MLHPFQGHRFQSRAVALRNSYVFRVTSIMTSLDLKNYSSVNMFCVLTVVICICSIKKVITAPQWTDEAIQSE